VQPDRVDQPGAGAQPDRVDQPGAEAQPDRADQPGAGAQPGRADQPGGGAQPGGRVKPGRRVWVAVGVGLCLGGAVLLSLYVVRWFFLAIMILFLGIAVGELTRALAARGVRVPVPPVALGLLAMVVSAWGAGPEAGPEGLITAFGFTSLAVMVWRLPAGVHGYVRDMTAGVFAAAYLPFLAGFAVLMLIPPDGADRIVIFIAVTIASDIGGFFVGSFLGRHKMAPAISPKKTWEGLAGSVVACMLIGGLLLPTLLEGHWWQGVILGAIAAGSATFGDLVVSMIKRDLGIKDMGGLIPEHGGVMDRLDSLLATAPVAWLLLGWFIGF
jgi:phosphatidate cytidylyltransferase